MGGAQLVLLNQLCNPEAGYDVNQYQRGRRV